MGAVETHLPSGTKIGLLIAIPSNKRLITLDMVIAMSMQPTPPHLIQGFIGVQGKPVEEAREYLAEQAIELGAKYMWFVDDDTIPPPNTVRRLIYILENNPSVMVAGGIYVTKTDPPSPVVFRGAGLGPFWRWKVNDVFEVTSMGAGCMMVNCEVFKHLKKPYFPWPQNFSNDPTVPSHSVSEDVSFCNAVREAGFKVVAHGGVLCDHFDVNTGRTFSLPTDSYPYQPTILGENDSPSEKEN